MTYCSVRSRPALNASPLGQTGSSGTTLSPGTCASLRPVMDIGADRRACWATGVRYTCYMVPLTCYVHPLTWPPHATRNPVLGSNNTRPACELKASRRVRAGFTLLLDLQDTAKPAPFKPLLVGVSVGKHQAVYGWS